MNAFSLPEPMHRVEPKPSAKLTPPSRGLVLGSVAIAVVIAALVAWSILTTISGAVVGTGRIVVDQDRQVVQHPDGGVISKINVKDGDVVRAGDVLIEIDGTTLKNELAVIDAQYFELRARRGRLEAESSLESEIKFPEDLVDRTEEDSRYKELTARQSSLFEARRDTMLASLDQLATQSSQIDAQVDGIDAQLESLKEQLRLIGEELADQEKLLKKGLTQVPRVLALQREAASLGGQIGEAEGSRAQSKVRQSEIDLSRSRLQAQYRETAENNLQELTYKELELTERRSGLLERIGRLEVRAPASGAVYQLKYTTPNAVIVPAAPIMYLVPQDRPLLIQTQIAVADIDQISLGQRTLLRFSVFSARSAPELYGTVSNISPDALTDEVTQLPYYRVDIDLPSGELEKLGAHTILPGMQVEVFIQTGERTPLSYLIKPLADYFAKAMRE